MKHFLLLAGLLAVLAAPCAEAQVAVNPAALQQLAAPPPASAPASKPTPVAAPLASHAVHHHHRAAPPAPASPATAAKPALPAPVPATAKAPALVAPKPLAPVRLSFAPGSADLPQDAAAMLKPFCGEGGMISIDAHAPATPSDPSLAMRLSLSRALAVKDALTACGVPVQNIVPRAVGAAPGHADDQTIVATGTGAAH